MTVQTVTVTALGAKGDGIVDTPNGPLHVPYVLPGETVSVEVSGNRAKLVDLIESTPQRTDPACRHFGTCGGCSVQHLRMQDYAVWKRQILDKALRARGIETDPDPLVPCDMSSRRRAGFSVRASGKTVQLGFHRMRDSRLVDIETCPVLLPQISGRLDGLRQLARMTGGARRPVRMLVTATETGLDVDLERAVQLTARTAPKTADLLSRNAIARLTCDGQIVMEVRKPLIMFGGVAVTPPPGGFLQATVAAENSMSNLIGEHVLPARRIADLFSGCGTFALRLAANSAVHAVEDHPGSVAALDAAARNASGLKPVTSERRDLFRRPLMPPELKRFDAVVFDPPRAGAEEQARMIARSSVPRIAAVSCNPGTLARDLRILLDGGYRLERIVPIDQFLWSHHVEAVALLSLDR